MAWTLDFVGVGAARSGSTWLYDVARQHPDLILSELKEIHFFNERSWVDKNSSFNLGLDYYRSFWPKNVKNKKCGEVSPTYLFSDEAAERIHKAFPKAKIIINLRNPVDRAYSHYYLATENNRIPFEQALKEMPYLIEASMYANQVERFLKVFPKDQIMIILLDDIKKDADRVARNFYEFVGVNPDIKVNTKASNPAKVPRSKLVAKTLLYLTFIPQHILKWLMQKNSFFRKTGYLIARSRTARAFETYLNKITEFNRKEADKTAMKPETRAYLKSLFIGDITRLEKLINHDLSSWK